ncbi:MAG: hypothetical protein WC933_01360 [Candidatus Paceibacterota bacterium]|jgi:hypothetical protein
MGFLISVAILIVSSLISGFALKLLWGWFLVPNLGLPVISLVQSTGIVLIVELLTHNYIPMGKEERLRGIIHKIADPIIIVAIAWVLQFLM